MPSASRRAYAIPHPRSNPDPPAHEATGAAPEVAPEIAPGVAPALTGFAGSLAGRLALGMLAVHLLLVPVVTSGVLHLVRSGFQDQFLDRVRADAYAVAERFAAAKRGDGGAAAAAVLEEVADFGQVVFARLVTTAGITTYGTAPARFREDFAFGDHGDAVYQIAVPVENGEAGVLQLGYDEAPVAERIHTIHVRGGLLAAGYLLLTLMLSGANAALVGRTLHRLSRASRRIADGNVDEPFPPLAGPLVANEARDLAQDLERMRAALVAQRHDLADRETRLRAIFDNVTDGIIVISPSGVIESFNRGAERLFGHRAEEVAGRGLDMLMPESLAVRHNQYVARYVGTGKSTVLGAGPRELEARRKDGSAFPVEVSISEMRIGEQSKVIGVVRDVTERRQAEEKMRLAATVLEHAGEAILVLGPHGDIRSANPAFERLTGYRLEDVQGRGVGALLAPELDDGTLARGREAVSGSATWRGRIWVRHESGDPIAMWASLAGIRGYDKGAMPCLCILSDITEHVRHEQRLERLANRDPLTGLPNRNLLNVHLEGILAHARKHGETVEIIYIDLDRFKPINDQAGHDIGDLVLAEVAKRLNACIRESDLVARIGGDEFVVVLHPCHGPGNGESAQRLLQALHRPIHAGGYEFDVGGSLGTAIFPDDGTDVSGLLRAADSAMYRAKQAGGDRVCGRDRQDTSRQVPAPAAEGMAGK